MNTFIPYPDFQKSAKCLDYKRLGKQRVEAWQIYNILKQGQFKTCLCEGCLGYGETCSKCKGTGKRKTAWYNHPAVQMWKGYEIALAFYCMSICNEWISRGYKDTVKIKISKQLNEDFPEAYSKDHNIVYPSWLGNKKFHDAMKSNLLRKDKKYYSQFGWMVEDNLPYIWGNE
jgi:hypothetical protein